MVLTIGQSTGPTFRGKPRRINPEIPMRFAFGINSTNKFFFIAFEKFESH